jgi:hypothetical protein
MRHNLHGIDIDLRATQIASLALWLRCHRQYRELRKEKVPLTNDKGQRTTDHEQLTIRRSNFVCAEPMPGEEQMLKEFVSQLEPKVLGQIVEVVFDKMKLAGEAGSLLKIEDEIRDTVAADRRQWEAGPIEIQLALLIRLRLNANRSVSIYSALVTSNFSARRRLRSSRPFANTRRRPSTANDSSGGSSPMTLCAGLLSWTYATSGST